MRRLRNLVIVAAVLVAAVFLFFKTRDRSFVVGDPATPTGAPPLSGTAPPPPASSTITQTTSGATNATKVEVLKSILASANDNDPRLDSEFKNMPPELKRQLEDLYSKFPREKFNERGTIVFLIGRDLKTADDAEFLFSVLREPPCKGFVACEHADTTDYEQPPGAEITRAYPQVNAFRALAKSREQVKSLGLEQRFNEMKTNLQKSDNDVLVRLANQAG